MRIKIIVGSVSAMLIALLLSETGMALAASEGNIDTVNKWAWGENAGWFNFRPEFGGAMVEAEGVYGYIWQEKTGWLKLACDENPPYENTVSNNWGVNNDGAGNLSGYGYSENAGWLNFNPDSSQVVIDGAGDFSGYGWSASAGWVNFSGTGSVN